MKKVEILGPGCPKCKFVEKRVKETIEELGIDAGVKEVTDMATIMKYGVMATPAVVVDGSVKSEGRIPTRKEIENWLISCITVK
jgi:small redox-active disulfide protein 2